MIKRLFSPEDARKGLKNACRGGLVVGVGLFMQKGDLISIAFTGKDASTGKVFDTTDAEVAKKEGLETQGKIFGPVPIIVGQGEILPGLDESLLSMNVGESKKIALEANKAFGERNPQLIRVLPLSEFTKNKISPVPGTIVNANDMIGKVQSVSGGRVRVDFNPDLAGKKVEYELKVTKHYTESKEQLDALVKKAFPAWEKPHVKHEKEVVEVQAPIKEMTKIQRNVPGFSKLVLETLKGVKEVKVTTLFVADDFKRMHTHADGSTHWDNHE
jgi:FKBP-type peptidyl-prolyl cis-trans isomerase SlyD